MIPDSVACKLEKQKKEKDKKKVKDKKKMRKKNCGNHFLSRFQLSNFVTILIILAFFKACNSAIIIFNHCMYLSGK